MKFKPNPKAFGQSKRFSPHSRSGHYPPSNLDPVDVKRERFTKSFEELWTTLFNSPVHLDSALSKLPTPVKSVIAQMIGPILLRPVTLAEALGVGVPAGEPWSLTYTQIGHWRAARTMGERLYEALVSENPTGIPAVKPTSDDFPPEMLKEFALSWSPDIVQRLILALGAEAPLSVRVARKITREDLSVRLKKENLLPKETVLSDLSPTGLRLPRYSPILNTEAFRNGEFEIQDEGSQVMSYFALWPELFESLLSKTPAPLHEKKKVLPIELPKKPEALTIIDACAGAGGKTLALADAQQGRGRIYAYDTSEKKLLALKKRAVRAGLNNIQTLTLPEGREEEKIEKFRDTADLVLVDSPCSGWGVLRRNPDIKWRQPEDVLERMPHLQLRLVTLYADLVKAGGRLVYGVCTFRKAETLDLVAMFLEQRPDFKAESGGYLGPGPTDGFFMQAFTRMKP